MANEGAREREVHRFYLPWLETFHATSTPATIEKNHKIPREDDHIPQSSQDRALTAFAQLGALRLNAKRCVVTLIDNATQYVLAEATKSLSLMDDLCHEVGDELWLGNSRIPRGQGVSEDALFPKEYTAKGPNNEELRAPALVIGDLAKHPRYADKKYAGTGGINFYAGVPITTNRGHTIGVYTIVDDKPREGLNTEQLRFMLDMAVIVLQHLESIRNERARARGERLIQGIGTFIEGDPIDANLSIESPGPNIMPDPLAAAGTRRQRPKSRADRDSSGTFKGLTIADANTVGREQYDSQELGQKEASSQRSILPPAAKEPVESHQNPYKATQKPKSQHAMVFDRAAKIMRKCLGADGVVFLDASPANLSKGTARRESTQTPDATGAYHSQEKKGNTKPKTQSAVTPEHELETPSATYTADPMETSQQRSQPCEVIALSIREIEAEISFNLNEHDLRKLVRRHPQGKCYSFEADGKPAFSDDSASEGLVHVDGPYADGFVDRDEDKSKRKGIKKNALSALWGALPKARTVVFLPLWDFSNQRWNAAAVMWSSSPVKLMNVGQDFSYLRAFANSVMNEIARLNLSVSDAAKATFLANISHELRSPLHGILGSIEFLHDTALDDFQSSMVISVETCGKTLLDTVEHVLDFAKLNNLSKQGGKRKGSSSASTPTPEPTITGTFDLAVVVEEAVEAVYAGQVFRTAKHDVAEGNGVGSSLSDKAMAARRLTKDQIATGKDAVFSPVHLTLNIDNGVNWHVTSQSGAVRRIVMNLLGNSLKYTEKGSINVTLEMDTSRMHDKDGGLLHSCITVTDTGKGMSDDFVRNHAFTAFSQEDSLAAGTGLGLSIIRSIVDSLGGKIDLRSQKDRGTEVKIWLSLPAADDPDIGQPEKSTLRQMSERTASMSFCLLDPRLPVQGQQKAVASLREMPTVEDSLKRLLAQWFSRDVSTATNIEQARKMDFIIYAEPPSIEYLTDQHKDEDEAGETPIIIFCQNAFHASSLRISGVQQLTEIGIIIEVIAQPVGPQKLARVLQRCMQRMKILDSSNEAHSSEQSTATLRRNDPISQSGDRVRHDHRKRTSSISYYTPPVVSRQQSDSGEKPRRPQPGRAHSETAYYTQTSRSRLQQTDHPAATLHQPPQHAVDTSLPGVLVVDDNQINLQLMVTFVHRTRHPYESATDGTQALEAYRKACVDPSSGKVDKAAPKRPKYILMDINMPNMDGSTATREIRKFEKENHIEPPVKIFALTGLGELEHPWAKEAGFDRLLSKPIKFKDLRELLL
ncbi:uncharacterized protein HMPREF1541_00918 [Cyphellophora europaea CBS 101466]|uniref:Histidine kinase n=1 Tax=Cyphellophora europaea (strain CBS 101466) TaxID=1220924 RepID=W2SFQ2_CYPE1|nr:uncharacterized protein HMPREF1541_00918 [Cyphellophora europaea CBS 101466]ETN46729.1 hypothetical protein HMPREF1541_00918 [Cyphellophora europaea CBS 101466]